MTRTREQWLTKLASDLRPLFKGAARPLPKKLRISCGWPSSGALATPTAKNRTVGQCWSTAASSDGTAEVFISPCISDAAAVAAILAHELCHAADDCLNGHGPEFKRIANKIGLEGKMTETTAGPMLAERLNALCEKLGPYPHATLDKSGRKKQGTRMIKLTCPECGYTARTTRQWIDTGLPVCPCDGQTEMQPPAEEDS